MKVLMLSDPASNHTVRWVNSLFERGVEIFVFGFNDYNKNLYKEGIKIETINVSSKIKVRSDGALSKIVYITSLIKVKDIIKTFKPDLMHAQYATSYGLIGALTNFHPYLIQVWGSDIYNFPEKSFFHRKLISYNFNKADRILSTSKTMLLQTKKYTHKEIDFFYLGVDTDKFKPMKSDSLFSTEDIVIGTIKTLEKKYGIEYLIKAFRVLKDKLPAYPLKLLIVGGGTLESHLKKLVHELKLENDTVFTGFIQPNEIPKYYNMLTIYATLSIEESESFGLAVIEASSCEIPVVVSNVGGLPEAVENNLSGFIVENRNIQQAAEAFHKLVTDKNLRIQMGKAGRERVIKKFDWNEKVSDMINLYNSIVTDHSNHK